ncbi:MAG TPA: DegT/DnrJ/EryC1/StrS family aminotransferase [Rhodothermales bacterium]|nr:DegT/DnrJ/EryC1/StrS family aminotransferase [Rhodothermales bacterium]
MTKLALLGGTPVTDDLLTTSELIARPDLERKYLLETYDSGVWDDWPGMDSMAARFEQEWATFNDSAFCALVTNGTHTLQLALEALDVGYGDEVIVPGLTWQATASVVCDVNAVPVLVDVDPETLCIDPVKVEAAITPRTRAIIPVHLYHRMADLDALQRIAQQYNLDLIEDCAHTHGSQWQGTNAGTLGTFGSFSFQRSKLMNGAEGGALLTQDEDLHWKVVSQRSCGREVQPGVKVHSGNYRLTGFQAAILRGQLAALIENAPVLDRNGRALDRAVADAPGVKPLRRDDGITRQCSYGFVFLFDREAFDGLDVATFREALALELGISFHTTYAPLNQSEVYYPHTKKRHQLSREYVKAITPSRWDLPVAEDLWQNQVVMAQWHILGCPATRVSLLTDAIAKIYEAREMLLAESAA